MVSRRVQALLDQLRAQGIQDEQVLNALAAVPRLNKKPGTISPCR
jgi:protein-L-isoaspartate(D-aspartate) O-methyltransferase